MIRNDGEVSAAPLAGQVAIVTGASRGIGRAVAVHLARRGATVAGIARPSAALTELKHEAEQEGLGLVTFLADVTVPADIELAFATGTAQLGPPDLVIACAGTAKVLGPLWLVDPDLWWQAVAVDLRGTMLTARAAVSRMLPRRTGRLVTVYGNLGDRQVGNVSAFAVAKAGIARLTETLAFELDGTGLRVFCVHPGFVRTPTTEHLAWSADGRTWLPRFGWTAQQRWGGPQPAADLMEAIALGAADQLSGGVLHVGDDLTRSSERCHKDADLRRLRLNID